MDKKSNIITVAGLLTVFGLYYAYSFFGIGAFSGDRFRDETILSIFQDEMNLRITGNADNIIQLLTSIDNESMATISQETLFLGEILQQVFVVGDYHYAKEDGSHSLNLALTDSTYGVELISLKVLYENQRLYFSANPLFTSNYYYDRDENYEAENSQMRDTFIELFSHDIISSEFVKREGADGKTAYIYKVMSYVYLTEDRVTDITYYIKPEGKLSEILIGNETSGISMYFMPEGEKNNIGDFADAKEYDINDISKDLEEYAEGLMK